jgi:hypothetical protein
MQEWQAPDFNRSRADLADACPALRGFFKLLHPQPMPWVMNASHDLDLGI